MLLTAERGRAKMGGPGKVGDFLNWRAVLGVALVPLSLPTARAPDQNLKNAALHTQ